MPKAGQISSTAFLQPSGPGAESMQPLSQGYNAAMTNLNQALQLSGNTVSGQMKQLRQQYQNQLGLLNQNLINKGLGNTTLSQTMAQAPLRSYNLAANEVQNTSAMRQMQMLQALAGMQSQGGTALSGMMAPYAQSQWMQNQQQSTQNQQNYLASLQAAWNAMNMPTGFGFSDRGPSPQQPQSPYGYIPPQQMQQQPVAQSPGGMYSKPGAGQMTQVSSPDTVNTPLGMMTMDEAYALFGDSLMSL